MAIGTFTRTREKDGKSVSASVCPPIVPEPHNCLVLWGKASQESELIADFKVGLKSSSQFVLSLVHALICLCTQQS